MSVLRTTPVLAVIAVAAVALEVALREPDWAIARGGALAVELAAGLALAVAGAALVDRRAGALLQAAGAAWLAAEWASPGAGALVFTIGLVAAPLAPALVAQALVRYRGAAWIALAGLGLVSAAALFTDPRASGCAACPPNLVSVADAPGVAEALERWGLWIATVALAVVVLALAWRVWRASAAARRALIPTLAPGALFLALVVAGQIDTLRRGWEGGHEALRLAESAVLLAVAAGVAWRRLRGARMRARLARLVVDLGGTVRAGGLRELLAEALGDPEARAPLRLRGGLDRLGGHASHAAHGRRAAADLAGAGRRGDRGRGPRPGLLEDFSSVIQLVIDHERLQAQRRGQPRAPAPSRTAIVAATDASAGGSSAISTTARSRRWRRLRWRSGWRARRATSRAAARRAQDHVRVRRSTRARDRPRHLPGGTRRGRARGGARRPRATGGRIVELRRAARTAPRSASSRRASTSSWPR